ncbi:hypothetical protein Pint_18959 [Pistacia integerrima]|uniref:Uncharacterized protein n=1 Tax=Pistacia integerrima TaxID=434235 RepID=A0ACC0YUJ6_9ROSI|nr:hypothetical protein Pint_18959 [Pistacia integerrima]
MGDYEFQFDIDCEEIEFDFEVKIQFQTLFSICGGEGEKKRHEETILPLLIMDV